MSHSDLLDRALLEDLAPSTQKELLGQALADHQPPDNRRVFVNRTLRLEKIRHIGFDLDWTLADYDQTAMSELAFDLALERLVETFNYPREILQAKFRSQFCRRGLMLDTEEGMVLKMNRHRYVGRAYHGHRFLDTAHRSALYRQEPINPSSKRYIFVDTLFELPEVNIFSELAELSRQGDIELPDYATIYRDTRAAVDSLHGDGSLKSRILADLPRYLPRDPQLVLALERLSLGGRKLLLITNSEWYYTEGLCSHLFDGIVPGVESWRELFDLVVVSARKPGFFKKASPFVELDADGNEVATVEVPQWGGVYSGGSREQLMKLLDCPGEQVLYVGDHIYGDILSSKLTSTWRTALVVRELEDELAVRKQLTSQLRHQLVLRSELIDFGQRIDDLGDILLLLKRLAGDAQTPADNGPAYRDSIDRLQRDLATLRAEHKAMRKHAERLQRRISTAINVYWGSLFKQGSNKSLFGSQVDDFACLYTSRVSNFAYYGSKHYFRVLRDSMMHESVL